MLEFFRRFFFSGAASSARNKREANARAWLDDLRQNELSMNARRRIAPDEPVKAPGIGHGSSLPIAPSAYIPLTPGEAQNPVRPPATTPDAGALDVADASGGRLLAMVRHLAVILAEVGTGRRASRWPALGVAP